MSCASVFGQPVSDYLVAFEIRLLTDSARDEDAKYRGAEGGVEKED